MPITGFATSSSREAEIRILCLDTYGECALGWLIKCQAAGHSVRWYYPDKKRPIGKGLVPLVNDWHDHVDWCDLIFCPDNLRYLRELDALRKRDPRKMIIAPSQEAAAWETDRLKGMQVLRAAGIEVPASREFSDYDTAIAYVKKQDRAFVSKPCGDETDKALSYVAKSPKDMVSMLERWKRQNKLKGKFILQEKVKGVEAAVGAWCGPEGFTGGWEENHEFKKLMPTDKGPNTGEMGTVMRYVDKSKLADKVLKPLEQKLVDMGYVGDIDVNCIIDESGVPYPLEFTMRPGWPAFLIQYSLTEGDPVEWMADLWEGKRLTCFRLNEIAVGFVLAIPDFPYSHATAREVVGIPIWGMDTFDTADFLLCQAMLGEAPHDGDGKIIYGPAICTAGDYIGVVTATAATVHDARRKALNALNKIEIPNSPFWREDIGRRLKQELPAIQRHGYSIDMEY